MYKKILFKKDCLSSLEYLAKFSLDENFVRALVFIIFQHNQVFNTQTNLKAYSKTLQATEAGAKKFKFVTYK